MESIYFARRILQPVLFTSITIHILLVLNTIHSNTVTVDELGHIPSGLAHWTTGTYNAYRVNPPLARLIATIPLLFTDVDYTGLDATYADVPGHRQEWVIGDAFAQANASKYHSLVCLARYSGIAWSLLAILYIYRLSQMLTGSMAAASFGVVLWCFEPNVIAHTSLATPDIPAAALSIVCMYTFLTYFRNPTGHGAWFSGIALGLALLVKFTSIAFVPMVLIMSLMFIRNYKSILQYILHFAFIGAISLFTVNAGYQFNKTFRPLSEYEFISVAFAGKPDYGNVWRLGESGNRFKNTILEGLPIPLPYDYLRGIDAQQFDFETMGMRRQSYLLGEWREVGWWYYYIFAFAVKSPVIILALLGVIVSCDVASLIRRRFSNSNLENAKLIACVYIAPIAIITLVSMKTGFNHHMRYIFPAFPFIIVLCSRSIVYLRLLNTRSRRIIIVVAIVFLLHALVTVSMATPHTLSYFNEIVGGPDQGHKYLLDSNIDWGQDLLSLKKWLADHPEVTDLYLAYFNTYDPIFDGVKYRLPPVGNVPQKGSQLAIQSGPVAGYHAISVNYLYGMRFMVNNGTGGRSDIPRNAFTYYQHFTPIAKAGHSIYIYHITEEEADSVRKRLSNSSQ